MIKPYEEYLIRWCFAMAILFMIFAKKPTDFGDFCGKMFAWFLSPLVILLFVIAGYFDQYKFRWFKQKWFLISVNLSIKFLINGMMPKKNKK